MLRRLDVILFLSYQSLSCCRRENLVNHIGCGSKRLVAQVRLLSSFDEPKWIYAPVPFNGYSVHT